MANMKLYFIILTFFFPLYSILIKVMADHVIHVMSASGQQGDTFSSVASWLQGAGLAFALHTRTRRKDIVGCFILEERGNGTQQGGKHMAVLFGWVVVGGGGASEVQCSAGVRVQLERLAQPTRVINVASPQGSSWLVCVCMNERVCARARVRVCVYSIISPAGDGASCSHKPTWNFLNKGLIFIGSRCTVTGKEVASFFPIYAPTESYQENKAVMLRRNI